MENAIPIAIKKAQPIAPQYFLFRVKEIIQAIQTLITPERIEQALEKSQGREKRKRKLPASLVGGCFCSARKVLAE